MVDPTVIPLLLVDPTVRLCVGQKVPLRLQYSATTVLPERNYYVLSDRAISAMPRTRLIVNGLWLAKATSPRTRLLVEIYAVALFSSLLKPSWHMF